MTHNTTIPEVNIRDSYKYFYKEECRKSEEEPVSLRVYLDIVHGFIKFILRKIFQGYDVELSTGKSLGTVGIRGNVKIGRLNKEGEIRGLPPDWGATKRLWRDCPECMERREIIYHTNEHTNGISYQFVWKRVGMKIAHKKIYSLILTKGPKGNKRAISKAIISGQEFIVNPTKFKNYVNNKNSEEGHQKGGEETYPGWS